MKKHLIAWGILSTMFMANTFAQKDIDRPIMGWSSWNAYHVNISEELIKQQADALIKHGLKEAGYNYINIDDGFFGHRDETGKMHPHPWDESGFRLYPFAGIKSRNLLGCRRQHLRLYL